MKLTKRKMIIYAAVAAIMIAGVFLVGSRGFTSGADKGTATAAVESKVAVEVQKVKTVEKAAAMSYKATLEPSEEGIVSSKLNGKVIEILFENGKAVSQGDPLLKLDDQDIKSSLVSAQAQLAAAEAQYKSAQNQLAAAQLGLQKVELNFENVERSYDRTKVLFGQGAVSQLDMENSESALKAAKADLESAKVSVETTKLAIESAQANVEAAKASVNSLNNSLANTVIRAPISGIADDKAISIGQFVSPGIVLAKVKNISTLNAVIQVEQDNLKYVKEGMKARVMLDDAGAQTYEGFLNSISTAADPASRTFSCKILLDNKDGMLHPGVYAKVDLIGEQKREVMLAPIQALSGSDGNYTVFTVQDGKAKKVSVTIGELSKDSVEILSGLQKDQSIIITNLSVLQDGDAVTVSEQGE